MGRSPPSYVILRGRVESEREKLGPTKKIVNPNHAPLQWLAWWSHTTNTPSLMTEGHPRKIPGPISGPKITYHDMHIADSMNNVYFNRKSGIPLRTGRVGKYRRAIMSDIESDHKSRCRA